MSYNPTHGSFISRDKLINNTLNSYGEIVQKVGPSTTYNSTGANYNTAFILNAGSAYTLTPTNGTETITAGLIVGQIYPIALSKVVNVSGTTVTLLR